MTPGTPRVYFRTLKLRRWGETHWRDFWSNVKWVIFARRSDLSPHSLKLTMNYLTGKKIWDEEMEHLVQGCAEPMAFGFPQNVPNMQLKAFVG